MAEASNFNVGGNNIKIKDSVAREQISELNTKTNELSSNLSQLEYSDVAGGKNLFNKNYVYDGYPDNTTGLPNGSTTYGQVTSGEIKVKPNGKYIKNGSNNSNFPHSFFDENHNFISRGETSSFITVPSNAHYIRVCLAKSTIDTFQFEEGTTATEYEPFIPSIKMLSDEVKAQNESLDDYGMLNKFDGVWKQGYYQNSDGAYASSSTAICNVNKISVASGNVVKFKTKNIYKYLILNFFTSNDTWINSFRVENLSEVTATAPTNASYARISIFDNVNISPSQNIVAKVYVNNAIDEIKNDLGGIVSKFIMGNSNKKSFTIKNLTKYSQEFFINTIYRTGGGETEGSDCDGYIIMHKENITDIKFFKVYGASGITASYDTTANEITLTSTKSYISLYIQSNLSFDLV